MKTKAFFGSRHLNDTSLMLGLNYSDLIALSSLLLVGLIIKDLIGFKSVYPLLGSIFIIGFTLVPIRLRFRRKIIRDFFHFLIKKESHLNGRTRRSLKRL